MVDNNTQTIAQTILQTDTSEMDGRYLTFWTDRQLFGVPIAHVVQIVGMQEVTKVPEFPAYAKGIINLRGSIIPLIDMRLRLNKPESDYNERTCVIVTDINDSSVGFIVDEVDAVIIIPESSIAPPPQFSNETAGYITGVGQVENKIILLMDTRKIVGSDELSVLLNS